MIKAKEVSARINRTKSTVIVFILNFVAHNKLVQINNEKARQALTPTWNYTEEGQERFW